MMRRVKRIFQRVSIAVSRRVFHSFASKLTFYLFVFMALFFTVKLAVDYSSLARKAYEYDKRKYENHLEGLRMMISDSLNNIELVVAASYPHLQSKIHNLDAVASVNEAMMRVNSRIYGCAVALEPGFYPDRDNFMAYTNRDDDGKTTTCYLDAQYYDYFKMEWYERVKKSGRDLWTEPYLDTNASDRYMCTYCYPISDKRGRFVGVFTADVTLLDYNLMVTRLKPYDDPRCHAELISREGTLIASPHCSTDSLRNISDTGEFDAETVDYIMSHDSGDRITTINGEEYMVVHSLVDKKIGWRIVLASPTSITLHDVHVLVTWLFVVNMVFIVVLLLIIYFSVHNVLKPITVFSRAAQHLADDIDSPLPRVKAVDEVRYLRNSMENMRVSLCRHISDIRQMTIANERIANELRIARNIQNAMLPEAHPDFVGHGEFELCSHINPAKEVGGDLYDYIIARDRLVFIIGDASGKGVPAAMLMASICNLFRVLAHANRPAREIVGSINDAVCCNNATNMFATLIVGNINLTDGSFDVCNAGHTPPLVICRHNDSFVHLSSNIPVGVMENFDFNSDCFRLEDQSTILLYTDGVTEAENARKELFGADRLRSVAIGNTDKPVDKFIGSINDAIVGFTSGVMQSDDITMLAIRFNACISHTTLTLHNKLSDVATLTEHIEEISVRFDIAPKSLNHIMLAAEEAAVNVVSYAYRQGEDGTIEVDLRVFADKLLIQIIDSGKPFNPLKAPMPDVVAGLDERRIGGLGIMLVKNLADAVGYERTPDGHNVLSMRFRYTRE